MIVRVVGAGYLFFREADSFNKANSLGRQKAPLRSAFCLR
jgi:hypothetical protein